MNTHLNQIKMVVQVNDLGMVASEFRIGNFVNYGGITRKITKVELRYSDVHYIGVGTITVMINQIEPIQLTEEILFKVDGVEELDNNEWKYLLKISAAKLYFRFNAGKCYTQFNDTYLGDIISCLHELQNFCHVFKKELNVKL